MLLEGHRGWSSSQPQQSPTSPRSWDGWIPEHLNESSIQSTLLPFLAGTHVSKNMTEDSLVIIIHASTYSTKIKHLSASLHLNLKDKTNQPVELKISRLFLEGFCHNSAVCNNTTFWPGPLVTPQYRTLGEGARWSAHKGFNALQLGPRGTSPPPAIWNHFDTPSLISRFRL